MRLHWIEWMAKCAGGHAVERASSAKFFYPIDLWDAYDVLCPVSACILSVDAIANSISSKQKQREKNNNNNTATSGRANERIVYVIGQMNVVRK